MNKIYFTMLTVIFSVTAFSQDTWTVYNSSNSGLTFNAISDIEFDNQGNTWVASWYNISNDGIAKFDGTNWTAYKSNITQGTTSTYDIVFTTESKENSGTIGATTTIKLADDTEKKIFSQHNYTTKSLSIKIPVNAVSFTIDYLNENSSASIDMVFTNANNGTILKQQTFTGKTNYTYSHTFFNKISTNRTIDISIDDADNKWLGTWKNGLIKIDNEDNWSHFTTSNSDLPTNEITTVANDSNGNIWIGSKSGLIKFNGTNWTTYNVSNSGLPDNSILSIAIDGNNNVWLTTSDSLVEFTGSSWNINKLPENVNYGTSNSLRIDNENKKWIVTNFKNVFSFDGTNWKTYNDDNSCLVDCQNTALAVDTNNDIWVGAHRECKKGGLTNLTQCDKYLTSNSELPGQSILSLNVDKNGVKWIGTNENGLAKLEKKSLSTEKNIFDNAVKLYPNPINDYLNLEINDKLIGSQFSIYSINGRNIKNGKLNSKNNTIDLNNISKGVNLLKIQQNGLNKTIKFIK